MQDAIVRLSGLGTIVAQQVQIDDLQGQVDELTKQETVLLERIARLSARLAAPALDAERRRRSWRVATRPAASSRRFAPPVPRSTLRRATRRSS